MFKVETENGKIIRIWDQRYLEPVDITDGTGRFGYLAYTLKREDINSLEKPGCVPFAEKYMGFDDDFRCAEFGASLTIENDENGLVLDLSCDGVDIDGVGIFLPFNFISRKNGFWKQQFTASSPYHTADGRHHLFYLDRPDGNAVVCILENEIDCYQINYSPYLSGHFIRGITFWSQLDRAYSRKPRSQKWIRVRIFPVNNYREALEKATQIWKCSALYYDVSSCRIGEWFRFDTIGKWDFIHIISPSGKETVVTEGRFKPEEYGFYRAVPYFRGDPGMDCTVFAFDKLSSMHERATVVIKQDDTHEIGKSVAGIPIYNPPFLEYRGYRDYNLCEHCMWAWSALKYLLRDNQDDRIDADVHNLLHVITPENQINLKRCSYDPRTNYNTFGDHRIQEAYNGVNILLDAYRLYHDQRLLELAKTVMRCRLQADMHEDGGIYRHGSDGATAEIADYTTVTCMVFPVADLALVLRETDDPEAEYFAQCAVQISDHVVMRGLDFPTEGGAHPECNSEVEEGSMSCAALTVLYVYAKLEQKPEYLKFAAEVLSFHDAYSVYTPHPCMFRSSLRWWETVWEGDTDGPAICFGHAWTIWRAEAEFWYGILTHDDVRILDSYNGFMSNLSKTDIDGNMYAIYQHEQLSSGAITDKGWEMDRTNREGFPRRTDITLSRYAWVRAVDTWFDTVAILKNHVLMAKQVDGILIPESSAMKRLYIGDISGTFYIRVCHPFEVITTKRFSMEGIGVVKITVWD